MRLSKQEAAAWLRVSTATIERKIQRGELQAEKEPHGTRYRVWVIFDDDCLVDATVEAPVEAPLRRDATPVETVASTPATPEIAAAVEMARIQEQLKHAEDRSKGLEQLAEYHKKLLTDSEWRYQEILLELRQSQQNIGALMRALPAPKAEPPEEDPEASTIIAAPDQGARPRRRWWPFGRR